MTKNGKFMFRPELSKVVGAAAVLLFSLAAPSANAQVSRATGTDGAIISSVSPKASTDVPALHPPAEESLPAGASVIYSNFGTGSSIYNATIGYTEAGAEANDYPIAEAMSFVPASSYILLRINGAFTYVQGTNGMKLVLAEDNAGTPGKAIYAASFTNLPTFGTCCTVQTAKLTPTKSSYVYLKAGQRYWLYPLPADTTSYVVWNYDTTALGGTGAVSKDSGQSWTTATYATFGAFDLYGLLVN